jgi:hypothetical protein
LRRSRGLGTILVFDFILTTPVPRVDLASENFEARESCRTMNTSDFVFNPIRKCSVKRVTKCLVVPVYERRKTIERKDKLDEALIFAHLETFEFGLGIADRIERSEVCLKFDHEDIVVVLPFGVKTFQYSWLEPFKGRASKVSESVRDFVLVGAKGFGSISEVEFALNSEIAKFLRILSVESIRFACFGLGLGGTIDGFSEFVDSSRKVRYVGVIVLVIVRVVILRIVIRWSTCG